jgi:hypothetical protein
MKRMLALLVLLTSVVIPGFSQSNNYANGNGTIIEIKTDGNIKWVIRKHIQSIKIDYSSRNINLNIYDRPELENGTIIGEVNLNDNINITQVAEVTIADEYHYWVNVTTDNNINGWIFCGKYEYKYAQFSIPYFAGGWEILEYINIGGKSWTIRRMVYQHVAVWEALNIRDKPGLVDTKVISRIIPPENTSPLVNLIVTEATEEMETIDGITDRWLKINYQGVEGWIFGGYTSVERGGPKYHTPENIIYAALGTGKV